MSYGQQLVNDVVGASGEEASNSSILLNHTTGEIVGKTINNSQLTLTQGFQQTAQIILLSPKVILQGAAINGANGLMRDDLRTGNYLPTTSPYNPNIKESNNIFLLPGNDAVVDWVEVKLRNSSNRVVAEKSALVQRDGDIVSADGNTSLQLTTQNNDYYIEVSHRNHLGTMTKNTVNLSSSTTPMNFTDGSIVTHGNFGQAQINASTFALWAGNANGDGLVRYLGPGNDTNRIKDSVLNHPGNITNNNYFPYTGYDNSDLNLNGIVRYLGPGNDTNVLKDVIRAHPLNTTFSNYFPIFAQIPN